jgi:hypothetical protein
MNGSPTVGDGPDVFWLQARIHGNELHSTEAVLQILRYLASSGSAEARAIRENLTVIVIPMYNPDGATANIRQSTTPFRIDLNRDWELLRQPESRAWYSLCEQTRPRLALDLHHMGQSPVVDGTNQLNTFQIGARSIDPSRLRGPVGGTEEQRHARAALRPPDDGGAERGRRREPLRAPRHGVGGHPVRRRRALRRRPRLDRSGIWEGERPRSSGLSAFLQPPRCSHIVRTPKWS